MENIKKELEKYEALGFNFFQMREIKFGLQEDLKGIELYAKKDFSWEQMFQIRKGLEANLPVEIYADPKFEWEQMEEIRVGLEEGLSVEEVSTYAKVEIDSLDMEDIRMELLEKKNS